MPRASKSELNNHEKALDLLWGSDKPLAHSEIEFVLDNWLPYVAGRVDTVGAFFTPRELARTVAFCSGDSGRIVDICAGIGHLTWGMANDPAYGRRPSGITEIVAVEIDPEKVRVGQRLMPDVRWVLGDALDLELWQRLGRFDHAIMNPPFGRVKTVSGSADWLSYKGVGEFLMLEVAARVANSVTGIFPQGSMPAYYRRSYGTYQGRSGPGSESTEYLAFMECWPEAHLSCSSFDCADYDGWRGANPKVEIFSLEFPFDEWPSLPETEKKIEQLAFPIL